MLVTYDGPAVALASAGHLAMFARILIVGHGIDTQKPTRDPLAYIIRIWTAFLAFVAFLTLIRELAR